MGCVNCNQKSSQTKGEDFNLELEKDTKTHVNQNNMQASNQKNNNREIRLDREHIIMNSCPSQLPRQFQQADNTNKFIQEKKHSFKLKKNERDRIAVKTEDTLSPEGFYVHEQKLDKTKCPISQNQNQMKKQKISNNEQVINVYHILKGNNKEKSISRKLYQVSYQQKNSQIKNQKDNKQNNKCMSHSINPIQVYLEKPSRKQSLESSKTNYQTSRGSSCNLFKTFEDGIVQDHHLKQKKLYLNQHKPRSMYNMPHQIKKKAKPLQQSSLTII